jgi:hypothetical protein
MATNTNKTTNLTCGKCKETKSPDEFYKCSRRKTGKQQNCKECSKKINKEFRNTNPNYYWGNDLSYFKRNYERTIKYHSEYQKANKEPFIYKISTSNGLYIGCSKAKPNVRLTSHRNDFLQFLQGKAWKKPLPLLHKALKDEGDNWINCLATFKIIEVLPLGTPKETLYELETYWIRKHEELGYNMLNVNKKKNK